MAKSNQSVTNPNLPPAGDARAEELAIRKDALQQQAEERAAKEEKFAIKPGAFDVETELASQFDELRVSNRLEDHQYCWVRSGANGNHIKRKMAEGWRLVQGDDQEAKELRGVGSDTLRRIGDVVLMKIRLDLYKRNLLKRQQIKDQQKAAVDAGLRSKADRFRKLGVQVYLPGEIPDRVQETMHKRQVAHDIATNAMTEAIQEGRVPGVPVRK